MTLDDLQSSPRPAWLWDGARARLVWANAAGIAVFGGETLFDLIDLSFDLRNRDVARIAELCGELQRGTPHREELTIPAATGDFATAFDCQIHALPDGRDGLLMLADKTGVGPAGGSLMTGVLEAMPIAIVVVTDEGATVFSNQAAAAMFEAARLASLADLLQDAEQARNLLDHTIASGTITTIRTLETLHGEREVRVTSRRLEALDDADDQHVLIMLEDITERRALERSLLATEAPKTSKSAASSPPARSERAPPVDEPAQEAPSSQIADTSQPAPAADLPGVEDTPVTEQAASQVTDETHLAAAEPLVEEDTPADDDSTSPEPNLSGIADAISKAGQAAAAIEEQPPAPPAAPPPELPSVISRLLDHSDQAVVLHRYGAVYYANPAALELLDFTSLGDLAGRSGLNSQLAERNQPEYRVTVTTGQNNTAAFDVRTRKFPWPGDVMWQSKLQVAEGFAGSAPDELDEPDNEPIVKHGTVVRPIDPAPQAPEQTSRDLAKPFVTEQPDEAPEVPHRTAPPAEPEPVRSTHGLPQLGDTADAELRAIMDIAADGLVTMNKSGEIVNLSAGAEALFGYRLAEVAGQPFTSLLTDDSARVLNDYLAALDDGGLASVFNDGREITGIVSQGGEISLFMTITRLHQATHSSYCAVLRDITQWKKTEAELRQSIKDAEAASAQKSQFLARISHELRTPLNAILGFSDVMRSERFGAIDNPKYVAYANDIHNSGTHLLSLINDLLDLSKIEAGKFELTFTSVDLAATTAECVRLLQDQATAARVIIRQNLSNGLPNVVADARSMKQILLNLLSNAIKFTDPGGQVVVSAGLSDNGDFVLKVKDTGIGMNESELSKALEPFSRVASEGRAERPGTGLGLPLSRALTEANRARFAITSERSKGTLIEITFPTTRVLAD